MAITHTQERRSVERTGVRTMNGLDWTAMVLLIIGGLNWGLVGLANFDLVAAIFGEMSALSRIVYVLVGLSALWCMYTASKLGGTSRRRA